MTDGSKAGRRPSAAAGAALAGPLVLAALMAGCAPCPDRVVPLEHLIAAYNDNASAMPRLWARARVSVTFPGPAGIPVGWGSTSPLASTNALLLLSKNPKAPLGPHSFVLIGREAGAELFRIGSSVPQNAYYMWYRFGEKSGAWWGRHPFAGGPGVDAMPIDPNQLLAVLTALELPSDLTQPPLVALTMQNDPPDCHYVLTYIDRQPLTRKLLFRREIYLPWESRGVPTRPSRIDFFDMQGMRVMRASLSDYRPVKLEGPGTEAGRSAVIATDIRIDWPQRKSSVHIVLPEPTTRTWEEEAADLFDEDGQIPGIAPDRVVQVDKHLEDRPK